MRVTLQDCRDLGYCSAGIRLMLANNGCDWWDFLQNGIEADILASWNDENAARAIEQAARRLQLERTNRDGA